jgi:hypothetical protein
MPPGIIGHGQSQALRRTRRRDCTGHGRSVRLFPAGRTALARCSRVGPGGGYSGFAFEAARKILLRLRVAHAIDEHGSILLDETALYAVYRLAVDGSKTAVFVTERSSSGQFEMPPIDEVLAEWLACATHFSLVSTRPEPFVPEIEVFEAWFGDRFDELFSTGR